MTVKLTKAERALLDGLPDSEEKAMKCSGAELRTAKRLRDRGFARCVYWDKWGDFYIRTAAGKAARRDQETR